MKGKLIIIESGSDASGKQTQTEMLYERMREEGVNVRRITFPNYECKSSEMIKAYLGGEFGGSPSDVPPKIASTFYTADRYYSYKNDWEEFYLNGGTIISDRYTMSNMVHQGGKILDKKEKEEYLDWLYDYEFEIFKLPVPDMVIFLDMPIEKSLELISARANKIDNSDKKDIHESNAQYLKDCYKNSLELVDKYNWTKISCVENNEIRSRDDISKEIFMNIKKLY